MATFDAITKKSVRFPPPTYQKVCRRGGVRKPADDRRRGRERRRSILKPDRESSHRDHLICKAKQVPASLPGENVVGNEIHDRQHAYFLLNYDQPNITRGHALLGEQPNAQSPVQSKIPRDDDPYDAQYNALPSPYHSSDSQSDTEVGENEKMVWMLMPDGFPGVAPPTR